MSAGYDHDAAGHLTYEHNPRNDIAEVDVSYQYDLLGHLTLAQDGNGWWNGWNYDALGRAVQANSNLDSHALGHDAAGRLTRMSWGDDGFFVTYEYDAAGEMQFVREGGRGPYVQYTYDDLGRLKYQARANGASSAYGYDGASRLTSLTIEGSTPNGYGYAYNAAGQITTRTMSNDAYAWNPANDARRDYTVKRAEPVY